jgi:hypothetical protein
MNIGQTTAGHRGARPVNMRRADSWSTGRAILCAGCHAETPSALEDAVLWDSVVQKSDLRTICRDKLWPTSLSMGLRIRGHKE